MTIVYLALGSNLNQPKQQIHQALAMIQTLAHTSMLKISSFYLSRPMGPADQPDYVNAVCAIDTSLSPQALLTACQAVEKQLGRQPHGERWQARCLDIDMLLYGDQMIATPSLTIPHPGLMTRDFVLAPLAEIAPYLQLPNGKTTYQTLQAVTERLVYAKQEVE